MEDLLLEIKPKFIPLIRSFSDIGKRFPFFMMFSLFLNMLAFAYFIIRPNSYIINMVNNRQEELHAYCYITSMITLFIGVIIVTIISNYLDKKNFELTTYKVFNDRIEFEEGFINHKRNVVMFKDIKEIHLNQNFIQKKYNIGTINFNTGATKVTPRRAFVNGIKFTDIENPQDIYKKVKEIHERG